MNVDINKTKILFVDDDADVLNVLGLMFQTLEDNWDVSLAGSGREALEILDTKPIDVVVSDMVMPGMNGAQLLNHVMKRHPNTIRIILSGYADMDLVLRCVGVTHQYLSKPFDLKVLLTTIKRIEHLNSLLNGGEIRVLASKLSHLPTIPKIYNEIVHALESPECPIDHIGKIIKKDPSLSSKILQILNSAFFGAPRESSNIMEAVQTLGLTQIRTLALTVPIFSAFDEETMRMFKLDILWEHSLKTGCLARKIMANEGANQITVEQAFTAGLLHDVGKLIFAQNVPNIYYHTLKSAATNHLTMEKAENNDFHISHAEAGAYLLGIWGLPMPIVEAVAFHHRPSNVSETVLSPLTAVHAANVIRHEIANSANGAKPKFDMEYLSSLNIESHVSTWRSLV
ncbi:MAG: HDOD domain-containing protein [Verrucomicrobia bacterium]|nr:HDOD domain-containing protein [Verrucomicrobiota bacterium]